MLPIYERSSEVVVQMFAIQGVEFDDFAYVCVFFFVCRLLSDALFVRAGPLHAESCKRETQNRRSCLVDSHDPCIVP